MRMGANDLSPLEAETIANMAWQCPYVGGTAVFKARDLYMMYNPLAYFEDLDICNAVGVYKNGKGLFDDENAMLDSLGQVGINKFVENNLKVYPNPATTLLTIEYTLLHNEQSVLQLLDITGRKVKEILLPNNSSKVELMVNDLAVGVYTYKQINNGIQAKTGKLVIE